MQLYPREEVEAQVAAAIDEGVPALRATVDQLFAKYAHKEPHKAWISSLQEILSAKAPLSQ